MSKLSSSRSQFIDWLTAKLGVQVMNAIAGDQASGTVNRHQFQSVSLVNGRRLDLIVRERLMPIFPGVLSLDDEEAALRLASQTSRLVPSPIGVFDSALVSFAIKPHRKSPGDFFALSTQERLSLAGDLAQVIVAINEVSLEAVDTWLDRLEAMLAFVGKHPMIPELFACLEEELVAMPDFLSGRWGLLHNEVRLGNLLLDEKDRLHLIDFDLACLGDPLMDMGWFAAPVWQYGEGLVSLEAWRGCCSQALGQEISVEQLAYWQRLGQLRWAIMALVQAKRGRALNDAAMMAEEVAAQEALAVYRSLL